MLAKTRSKGRLDDFREFCKFLLCVLELEQVRVYSNVPNNDVSVNDVRHIRQWSYKNIIYSVADSL